MIAEIYPKACYGIALAETLPARMCSLAKTKGPVRQAALEKLRAAAWLQRDEVVIDDLDCALENEDDFDALMSAAALSRLFIAGMNLDDPRFIDVVAEGAVLGEAGLVSGGMGGGKSCVGTVAGTDQTALHF